MLRLQGVGIKVCIKPNAFGNALGSSLTAQSNTPAGSSQGMTEEEYWNTPAKTTADRYADTYGGEAINTSNPRDRLKLSNLPVGSDDLDQYTPAGKMRALAKEANVMILDLASREGASLAPTVANAAKLGLFDVSGEGMPVKYSEPDGWSINSGGQSALSLSDTQRRLNYHAANGVASEFAMRAIAAAETAGNPAAATEAAYAASQQRIDNRSIARQGLSTGGLRLSEAVDITNPPEHYFDKYRQQMPEASEYDLARRVSKGVASSNWRVDLMGGVTKFVAPIGVGYGAYSSTTNIIDASPSERPYVVAQEAGTWVGGWYGASWGMAGGVALAVALGSNPVGWGIIAAGALGGIAGGVAGSYGGAYVAGNTYKGVTTWVKHPK